MAPTHDLLAETKIQRYWDKSSTGGFTLSPEGWSGNISYSEKLANKPFSAVFIFVCATSRSLMLFFWHCVIYLNIQFSLTILMFKCNGKLCKSHLCLVDGGNAMLAWKVKLITIFIIFSFNLWSNMSSTLLYFIIG